MKPNFPNDRFGFIMDDKVLIPNFFKVGQNGDKSVKQSVVILFYITEDM